MTENIIACISFPLIILLYGYLIRISTTRIYGRGMKVRRGFDIRRVIRKIVIKIRSLFRHHDDRHDSDKVSAGGELRTE